jgi:hypothetical protein
MADESCGDFSRLAAMAIKLTDEDFALLYEYLDRENSVYSDATNIDLTTKIGVRLWRRIQEIATETGFMPTHESINNGLVDMPMYLDPDE